MRSQGAGNHVLFSSTHFAFAEVNCCSVSLSDTFLYKRGLSVRALLGEATLTSFPDYGADGLPFSVI